MVHFLQWSACIIGQSVTHFIKLLCSRSMWVYSLIQHLKCRRSLCNETESANRLDKFLWPQFYAMLYFKELSYPKLWRTMGYQSQILKNGRNVPLAWLFKINNWKWYLVNKVITKYYNIWKNIKYTKEIIKYVFLITFKYLSEI